MKIFFRKLSNNKTTIEAGKYFIVGGLCTLLDMVILYHLTTSFEIDYLLSSIISFSIAAVLNYHLSTSWIFELRLIQNRYHEFLYYILITVTVLTIHTLLIWIFTSIIGFYFMISKLFTVTITFSLNFYLRKYMLHSAR